MNPDYPHIRGSGGVLEAQLNLITQAYLVRPLNETEPAYAFRHSLLQETVYSSLLKNERKRLHARVGRALERTYPEQLDELAAVLAQHFAEAGDAAKTILYATRAGQVAARRSAYAEALAHYTRALEHARREWDAAPEDRSVAQQMGDLFLKRGRILELSSRYPEALTSYQELEALARARDDRALELAALMAQATIQSIPSPVHDWARAAELNASALELAEALRDASAQAKILWNQMLLLTRADTRFDEGLPYGERALAIARTHGLTELEAYIRNDLSGLFSFIGAHERARAENIAARRYWLETDNLPMLTDNLNSAAMNHLLAGEFEDAARAAQEALHTSREIGNTWGEAFAQTWVGEGYIELGEIGAAIDTMQAAAQLGAIFPPTLVVTRSTLAYLYAELGAPEQGIALARQALAAGRERVPPLAPCPAGTLASIYVMVGDRSSARAVLDEFPGTMQTRFGIYTLRARVQLAQLEGDAARALAAGETLLEYLRRARMTQYLPISLLVHARTRLMLEQTAEARALLDEAQALAERINARWSLYQILAEQGALHIRKGDLAAAGTAYASARALVEFIAARTPAPWRESFLARAQIQRLMETADGLRA